MVQQVHSWQIAAGRQNEREMSRFDSKSDDRKSRPTKKSKKSASAVTFALALQCSEARKFAVIRWATFDSRSETEKD
jgi:hypothetical protein